VKKAQFTDAEVAAAADEFRTYMAPRVLLAGGKNGEITVYGENPNTYRPPVINIHAEEEEINGLLQELGN
jgi:hypothetical protein